MMIAFITSNGSLVPLVWGLFAQIKLDSRSCTRTDALIVVCCRIAGLHVSHCNALAHCNTLQHTATLCNTLPLSFVVLLLTCVFCGVMLSLARESVSKCPLSLSLCFLSLFHFLLLYLFLALSPLKPICLSVFYSQFVFDSLSFPVSLSLLFSAGPLSASLCLSLPLSASLYLSQALRPSASLCPLCPPLRLYLSLPLSTSLSLPLSLSTSLWLSLPHRFFLSPSVSLSASLSVLYTVSHSLARTRTLFLSLPLAQDVSWDEIDEAVDTASRNTALPSQYCVF